MQKRPPFAFWAVFALTQWHVAVEAAVQNVLLQPLERCCLGQQKVNDLLLVVLDGLDQHSMPRLDEEEGG